MISGEDFPGNSEEQLTGLANAKSWISWEGFPGNAEELATGLANAQSWISGVGFPGDPEEPSNRTSNGPLGSQWAPPMDPQVPVSRAPKQEAPWAPCGPRSGAREAAGGPQGPLHMGMGPGAHQAGLGVEPLSCRGSGGQSPSPELQIPSEYGVCWLTFDVQGS